MSQRHRVQRHRSSSGLLAAACLLYSGSALNVGTRGPGATAGTQHLSAPALQVLTVSSGPVSVVGRDQALQQAPSSARPWADALQASLVAALAGSLLVSGSPAWAENELADLANSKSTSELVDPQCFADKCSVQTKACIDNPDCTKGLVCTAKCMGDAQCTVGCFARFGNPDLDKVLSCTIEDAACIKIALMEPGADGPLDAPLPPRPIIPVSKSSLQGKWYKVMGWNPMYDCFDCQCNTFDKPSAKEVGATIEADSMNVEVQYSMPRVRAGMKPERFSATLHEQLEFDTTPGSRRTAHTEGKMFGLTFWENWYVLGENKPNEPQFKFVYYTGKTLQNRYEGAFVYSRQPELPRDAMPHIYRLARDAGMEPQSFCAIDNVCFNAPPAAGDATQRPLFTPVAQAAEGPSIVAQMSSAMPSGIQKMLIDATEYIEDPVPSAKAIFGKQKQMSQIREYDAKGYRVPSTGGFVAPASALEPEVQAIEN